MNKCRVVRVDDRGGGVEQYEGDGRIWTFILSRQRMGVGGSPSHDFTMDNLLDRFSDVVKVEDILGLV